MNKKYIDAMIIGLIVLILSNLFMFFRLTDLNRKFQDLNHNINRIESSIDNSINNISYSVSEALKTEASIINDFRYEYGKIKDGSVELKLIVKPKEISNESEYFFSYSMSGEEKLVDASVEGTSEIVSNIKVPIKNALEVNFIVEDGDNKKIELLNYIYALEERLVEPFNASFSSKGIEYFPSNNTLKLYGISCSFDYHKYEYKEYYQKSNSLVNTNVYVSINDKVIDTFPMEKRENPFPESESYTYTFGEYSINIKAGDKLYIYILAEHEDGYKVRMDIDGFYLAEDGNFGHPMDFMGSEKSIVY